MGADEAAVVCEGVLEKKVDHRRLPIGPTWKRKYCVLNAEALRLYRSKNKMENGCLALKIVPLCHIKGVAKIFEDKETKISYFNLFTEQGETLTFRCKNDIGWVAQIQIQQIHYKNRQDILRYKHLSSSLPHGHNTLHRLRLPISSTYNTDNGSIKGIEPPSYWHHTKDCLTIVLPNHRNKGVGIGITVIPSYNGKVLVNRLLENGPAIKLGVLRPGDEIVSANGTNVNNVEMLSKVVQNSHKTVTLTVRQNSLKSSQTMDDPKRFLKQENSFSPEYINAKPYVEAKIAFENGYTK